MRKRDRACSPKAVFVLKVALIGTGAMAQKQAQVMASHPGVEPFLICSTERSREQAQAFQREYGFRESATSYRSVLEKDEVDAVIITSPDQTHCDFVARGLKAGKHVLCEKPLASSEEEFERIEQANRAASVVLQVGMNCRYRMPYVRSREIGRELGRLRFVRGTYLLNKIAAVREGGKPWWGENSAQSYFFLHANGVHVLDLMRWFGGEVKNVFARGACLELTEFHADTFSLSLEFQSGALGEVLISISTLQPREVEIQTWHDQGTIKGGKIFRREGHQIASEPEILDLHQPVLDLHLQLDDFLAAIERGSEPMNGLAEARANFGLVQAVERSLSTGRVITLGHAVLA